MITFIEFAVISHQAWWSHDHWNISSGVPGREFSPNWWFLRSRQMPTSSGLYPKLRIIKSQPHILILLNYCCCCFSQITCHVPNFLFHAAKAIFDWLNWHIEIEPATCATTIRRCLDDTRPQWNVYKLGVCIPGLFDLHLLRDTFAFPSLSF